MSLFTLVVAMGGPAGREGFDLLRAPNGRFGITNPDGTERIPPKYTLLSLDRVDLFPVLLRDGRTVLRVQPRPTAQLDVETFTLLRDVRESPPSFPIAYKTDHGCGLMDGRGENVAAGGFYDEAVEGGVMDGGVFYVRRDALWGLISWQGRMVAEPRFRSISRRDGWPKVVEENGGQTLLDSKGRLLMKQPVEWIDAQDGSDGMQFKAGGKVGALSQKGQILVPARFDDVKRASEKLFLVQLGGLWGVMDHHGKELIPVAFDALEGPFQGRFRGRKGHAYSWTTVGAPRAVGKSIQGAAGQDEPYDQRLASRAPDGKVSLLVDEQPALQLLGDGVKVTGSVTLVLVNRTPQPVEPRAADGVPLVEMETRRADGTWQEHPEWNTRVTCGNSYAVPAGVRPDHQRVMLAHPPREKGVFRFVVRVGDQKITTAL